MDWFKMQTVWGASIDRFSDAEAGRFLKAIMAFVRHGTEYDGGSGREDPLIWQALETLREDVESFKRNEAVQKAKDEEKREKRRQAANKRWAMQNNANASKCMQTDANESTCTICNANASENKNKSIGVIDNNKDTRTREDVPFGLTDEDVHASLLQDQQIEEAAKRIGLQTTEAGMMKARELVRQYGLSAVLDAISKSVDVPKWAYVEGVLRGGKNGGAGAKEHRGNHGGDHEQPSGKYAFLFRDAAV